MVRPDETDYDPALPGRIRGELGGGPPPPERLPGPAPSRLRFILTGVVTAGLLAAWILSQGRSRPQDARASRGAALAEARRHLAERDWGGALADLAALERAGSAGEEGRLLADAARGMRRIEAAEGRGDWVAAYDAALDLDRLWREEGGLRVEVSRRLDRARSEVMAGQRLAEGRDLLAAGDPARALEALREVPEGTACAEAARAQAERARASLRDRATSEAARAADQGRWEEAQRALDALGKDPEDPRAGALAARIASGRSQQEALERAEALLAALRVEEARAALGKVDPQGVCAAPRSALADRLQRAEGAARRVAQARERFDLGEGEEAQALLAREADGRIPAELRQGIARTLSTYQDVLEALDRSDDLSALEGVRRLCALPLAEGNWYRARAEAAREPLERKVAALAEQAVAEGVQAFRERRYRDARAAFERAGRAAPAHPVAEVYRRRFLEVGRDLYRDGYVLRAVDPAAARARFEEALACLPEDDATAAKAREALRR